MFFYSRLQALHGDEKRPVTKQGFATKCGLLFFRLNQMLCQVVTEGCDLTPGGGQVTPCYDLAELQILGKYTLAFPLAIILKI